MERGQLGTIGARALQLVVVVVASCSLGVSAQPCDVEDISRDGAVDFTDFFWLVDQFGRQCARDEICDAADLDRDGTVDSDDFFAFSDVFGAQCEGTGGTCIPSGDHMSIQNALAGEGGIVHG